MILQGRAKYPVKEVILHTAALGDPADFLARYPSPELAKTEIRRWHMDRGWRDIGYHYGVMPNGAVFQGRAETAIGAHVKGHNRGTIGIVMLNVKPHRGITRFPDYFTSAQKRSVKRLIASIASRTDLERVSGHNDYTNLKECPGFRVVSKHWMPRKRRSFWDFFRK